MKLSTIKHALIMLLACVLLQSCVKDTCKRYYTVYTPVYKTVAEVRANIKSASPEPMVHTGKLFVLGNYIFVNEIDKGIHVIDNTDPTKPINKYFIHVPGNVDLAVTGNTLYADLYSDMVTLDISNPNQVQVKNIAENAFPFRRYQNGFIADTSMIIVDWKSKDTTVVEDCATWTPNNKSRLFMDMVRSQSISNSAAPVGISGSMARFCLQNNTLYTVTDNALNIFSISQPQQPVFAKKVGIGWGIETIYPFKENLFIGSTTGMLIYSITNPLQPTRMGSFTHANVCDPVIADDDYAYVTLRSGNRCQGFTNQLDIVNVSRLMQPTLVKSYLLNNPHGLSKDNNLLFICDGKSGLKVFDAANVYNLKLLQTITGIDAYDVIAYNKKAIVVASNGLFQYDYSNPGALQLLSKITRQ